MSLYLSSPFELCKLYDVNTTITFADNATRHRFYNWRHLTTDSNLSNSGEKLVINVSNSPYVPQPLLCMYSTEILSILGKLIAAEFRFMKPNQTMPEKNAIESLSLDAILAPTVFGFKQSRFSTTPTLEDVYNVVILSALKQKTPSLFNFLDPFQNVVWLALLASFIATLLVTALATKLKSGYKVEEFQDWVQFLTNIGLSLIRTLLGQEWMKPKAVKRYHVTRPRGGLRRALKVTEVTGVTKVNSGQKKFTKVTKVTEVNSGQKMFGRNLLTGSRPLVILMSSWVWLSAILNFSFSNQLFSALIYAPKLCVNSLEELITNSYEGLEVFYISPSTFDMFIHGDLKSDSEEMFEIRQRIQPRLRTKTFGELFGGAPIRDIAEGKAVLVNEDIFLKELINLNPLLSLGVSSEKLLNFPIGYFINRQSPVRKILFQIMQDTVETGIFRRWRQDSFSHYRFAGVKKAAEEFRSAEIAFDNDDDSDAYGYDDIDALEGSHVIEFEHLLGAFYVLMMGHGLAFFSLLLGFLIECYKEYCLKCRQILSEIFRRVLDRIRSLQ